MIISSLVKTRALTFCALSYPLVFLLLKFNAFAISTINRQYTLFAKRWLAQVQTFWETYQQNNVHENKQN